MRKLLPRLSPQIKAITSSISGAVKEFTRSRAGTVAVIFAIALIPILIFMGAALDFARAADEKVALDSYADSSVLLAVSRHDLTLSDTDAETDATNFFDDHLTAQQKADLKSFSVTVSDSSSGRNASVTYVDEVPTTFMKLVDINQITLNGQSAANSNLPSYIDFYLLLDNTPSMGIGATTSDINTMVSNTPDQCAFACHDLSTYPNDYYSLAKMLGVNMRIDVMREATQQLMSTATSTEFVPDQFRMAIYTFGSSASNAKLTTIQSLTTNLSAASSAASAIDLMTVPYQNYADDTDTNLDQALNQLDAAVPSSGDGSQTSPLEYVFLVSDGVSDRALGSPDCTEPIVSGSDPRTGQTYRRCQEPIDPSVCADLKDRGIKIAVLYTTYYPLPTNAWYNTWIAPFQSQIATNMQSCASPGFYFEVSPSQGITQAMIALFQKAIQNVRLTQ